MVPCISSAKSYLEWSPSDLNRFIAGLGIVENRFFIPASTRENICATVVDLLKEQEEEFRLIPQGALALNQIPANPDSPLFYFQREEWLKAYNKLQLWALLRGGIEYMTPKLGQESDVEIASQLASWMASKQDVLGLKTLTLSQNNMTRIPEEIGLCTQLESLMISHNPIKRLPPQIGNLRALKWFVLMSTHVQTLPDEFQNLQQLEKIEISSNRLQNIDPVGFLRNLTHLAADSNQVQRLPPTIHWERLKIFFMMDNLLTELPEEFYSCTSLVVVFLAKNHIAALSDSMTQLTKLHTLKLNQNRLARLPESLGRLPALRSISVTGNQLTDLPRSFAGMASLEEVSFKYNPLSQRPSFLPSRVWTDI